MKGLALIALMCMTVTIYQVSSTEDASTRARLDQCQREGTIERCAENHGLSLTPSEVFQMMATDAHWLTLVCHGWEMLTCVTGCEEAFSASKYSYMLNICLHKRVIEEHRDCWDEAFPEQARRCYLEHYPVHRQLALYPVPFRIYDQNSIARYCFPDEPRVCRFYKSYALYHMMPQYYAIFNYPEEFPHTEARLK